MTPEEIDSFVGGYNLTAANFSSPNFANLVAGGDPGVIQGATPSFETRSGIEGMVFANSATESIIFPWRALWGSTIVAISQVSNGYTVGGTYTAGNSFGMYHNALRVSPYNAILSCWSSTYSDAPHVMAVSWSPKNGTLYAQYDSTTPVTTTATAGNFNQARTTWHEVAIGRHRTTYLTGWVARVLVFDRALHYEDNDTLQALITSEMALLS